MNKKLLSCLLCLVLAVSLAFSASAVLHVISADVAPFPDFDNEYTEDVSGSADAAEPTQEDESLVKPIIVCIVCGLVIALIIVLSIRSTYKPVHRKRDAAQYLVDGSLQITNSSDVLVRTDVSERTIENTNTSGSGS